MVLKIQNDSNCEEEGKRTTLLIWGKVEEERFSETMVFEQAFEEWTDFNNTNKGKNTLG